MDITLNRTGFACPEQYEAYLDDKLVGYLRLRHGHFTVRCPNANGDIVYSSDTIGDGIFEDEEKDLQLMQAKLAIMKWVSENI